MILWNIITNTKKTFTRVKFETKLDSDLRFEAFRQMIDEYGPAIDVLCLFTVFSQSHLAVRLMFGCVITST